MLLIWSNRLCLPPHISSQVGREGHCSVEDATAAMELYRLVEVQWEQETLSRLPAEDTHSDLSPSHYMNDQYWPEDLNEDCQ